jgi:aspartate/methionine/tyrosine aminotransferase
MAGTGAKFVAHIWPRRVNTSSRIVDDRSFFCGKSDRKLIAVGVAAIPMSAFYADGFDQRVIRFCFAKKDETLNLALERLARL